MRLAVLLVFALAAIWGMIMSLTVMIAVLLVLVALGGVVLLVVGVQKYRAACAQAEAEWEAELERRKGEVQDD